MLVSVNNFGIFPIDAGVSDGFLVHKFGLVLRKILIALYLIGFQYHFYKTDFSAPMR